MPVKSLELPAFRQGIARQQFSLGTIHLMILLILSGSCSLRGARRVFEVVVSGFHLKEKIPSWGACRLWLMRLGYYKLYRAKEKGEDWVWIIDHTQQLDQLKCLFIVGLRLRDLPAKGQPLRHSDLEPLELFPVLKSTGEVVFEQLEKVIAKTGVPRAIVSDHGSDLKNGVELFRQAHPETVGVYDMKHKTAALLKRELHIDKRWNEFIKKAAETQNLIRQTALFPMAPPSQKSKARYMNLEELLIWGQKTLFYLGHPTLKLPQGIERKAMEEKLGWVKDFSGELGQWDILMRSIEASESLIRNNGLERGSFLELKRQFSKLPSSPQTARIQSELLDFVQTESLKAREGERLLGSSEVLESTFGTFKTLEGPQNKQGFTGFVLVLAALVAPTSPEVLHAAMTQIPTKRVGQWQNERMGQSAQAKRKMLSDQYTLNKKNVEQTQPISSNKEPVSDLEKRTSDSQGRGNQEGERSKIVKMIDFVSKTIERLGDKRKRRIIEEAKQDQFKLVG